MEDRFMSLDPTEIRRRLHAEPELSGQEVATARRIVEWLEEAGATRTVTGLGGHGVAGIFAAECPGPRVMFRAELDALPIGETAEVAWRSKCEHVAHSCGHDGHMATLLGLAQRLSKKPPERGETILLFQPSEETGRGARGVVESSRFEEIAPDHVFALHNLPGEPLGEVSVRAGAFTCASRGLIVRLNGLCTHAAHPEQGRNPALAMCRILQGLKRLPQQLPDDQGLVMVTLIHARLGEVAFGTSPGQAEVMATLRTEDDAMMRALAEAAVSLARVEAEEDDLGIEIDWCDVFQATHNHPLAVEAIREEANALALPLRELSAAHRWSEDFGWLAAQGEGALLTLGSGEQCHPLHHPSYDFPDAMLTPGIDLFERLVRRYQGEKC
ncbi:peptidase M20 [Chromohalobacter japonicus]|uniref:Peptidase M20 n=1 Tax=Chromohalobacter japonicus TaxID=223900 RepID=A0A1Q8TE89_9GAMM|nr:amidohydrolase [Chromohalobacter japonicus]OLO11986.1 peptidase M20 [Chromohalobacter japonicus]